MFQLLFYQISTFRLLFLLQYICLPHPLLITLVFFFTLSFLLLVHWVSLLLLFGFPCIFKFSIFTNFTYMYWISFVCPCEHDYQSERSVMQDWVKINVLAEILQFSKHLTILLVTLISAYPDKLVSYLTNFCCSISRICLQHNFVYWYVLKKMISFS